LLQQLDELGLRERTTVVTGDALRYLSSRHRAGLGPCSAAPPRAPTPSLRSGPRSGSLADREESGARPGGGPFDLVLVDPPYGDLELYAAVLTSMVEHKCLAADAVVVIEYEKQRGRRPAIPIPPGLESEAIRDHGQTALEFLRAVP
jgi:16S rRNA G966 N2-methylase RsmD